MKLVRCICTMVPVTVVLGAAPIRMGSTLPDKQDIDALIPGVISSAFPGDAKVEAPACGARSDGYSAWTTDCSHKVHTCEFTYATKSGGRGRQRVAIFYADPDRSGWAYFYNSRMEPWARFATPANVQYDPDCTRWQKLNVAGDGYEDVPPDQPVPTPSEGVKPIPEPPTPPK